MLREEDEERLSAWLTQKRQLFEPTILSTTTTEPFHAKLGTEGGEFLLREEFFDTKILIPYDLTTRFEHTWIMARTGHGKTSVLQHLIAEDLKYLGERSVIVIDTKGAESDLIKYLSTLKIFSDDPSKFVFIDPTDIDFPVGLSLFPMGMERTGAMSNLNRERVRATLSSLLAYTFDDLTDTDLTKKQRGLFSYIHTAMKGLRYITKSEIFAHASCPEKTRQSGNPLTLPLGGKQTITPDDLFGIEYPGGRYRFFAVEIDRGTESIERKRLDQTAYGQKLHSYLSLTRQDGFKTHWGLPKLMVMTVTTNLTHARNMMEDLKGISDTKLAAQFIFAARPEFGVNWRVPDVMRDLLTDPWQRASGEAFAIGKT